MKLLILCFAIALPGCAATTTESPPDDPVDPACAVDTSGSRTDLHPDDLAWDLDRGLDSDQPVVCPASQPDCDAMAETDTPEDDAELMLDDVQAPLPGQPEVAMALTELTSGNYRAWPHGRIPYVFGKSNGQYILNAATRSTVSKAMTNWEQKTEGRIKFRPKQSTDKEYITIVEGSPRVSPFVGYIKGKHSTVYLRQNEYITVSKHELGHVVGLHHEQRRSDRLDYIQVRTQNIVSSTLCKYQFSVCSTCKKIGTYDRISVMHYRTSDLGNCRTGPVLLKLDGSAIQHYWQLSTKDVNAVKVMYGTSNTQPPPPPPPSTTPALPETGSLVSGKMCAAVPDASTDPGVAIDALACDGSGNQDWRLTTDGQLLVQHSMQCAAVVGCSTDGAMLAQAPCSATAPDQKWTLDDVEIVNGVSGKCLAATASGVGFAACSGAPEQQFDYRPETETIEIDGMCVTAPDAAASGSDLVLAACDGRDGQRWLQARGGFVTRANTSRCLGAASDATAKLGDCDDSPEQRWALRGAIRDGRSGLCIQAGLPMSLAQCDGSDPQTWTFWSR